MNLPASLDAERAVLGAVIIEGSAGFRKLSLRAEHFYVEHNRDVFTAAQRLDGRGDPIDLLTITEELRRMGALDRIGGQGYVALLVEQASILVHLPAYERIVAEEATRRGFLALSEQLRYGATNGTSAAELAAMAETVLTEHRRQVAPRRPTDAPTELTALMRHRFPPQAAVVGGGILQRQTLMVGGGYSKIGKSILFDNLIIQRARGKPWLGFPTDPGATLICSSEIPPEGVQTRFRTMLQHDPDGEPPEGSIHVKTNRGIALDESEGFATIAGWIEETGATLLRIDPLARYMAGDENSTRDMSKIVRAVDLLMERYGVAVLIVHHLTKPIKDSPRTGGNRLRGASALFAAADTVAMFDPDGDAYRLTWELRHAAAPAPMRLKRTEDLWFVPVGLSDDDKAIGKIVSAIPLTYKALVGAIKEDLKVSEPTAKRRIASALVSKALDTTPENRYIAGPAWYQQSHEVSDGA